MSKEWEAICDVGELVCGRCCRTPGSADYSEECPSGKGHRLLARTAWASVMLMTWFDVRSPKTAAQCFEASVHQSTLCRRFTDQEIADLRSGNAHIEIAVVKSK
jgi:hypothetical protein